MKSFNINVYNSIFIHGGKYDAPDCPENEKASPSSWFVYTHSTVHWKEFIKEKETGINPLPFPTIADIFNKPLHERGKGVSFVIFTFENEITFLEMIDCFQEFFNYISDKEGLSLLDCIKRIHITTFFEQTEESNIMPEGVSKYLIYSCFLDATLKTRQYLSEFANENDIILIDKYLNDYKDTEIGFYR